MTPLIYIVVCILVIFLGICILAKRFKGNEVCLAGICIFAGMAWPFAALCGVWYIIMDLLVSLIKLCNKESK